MPGDLLRIALPYDTMPATHQWGRSAGAIRPHPDSPVQAPDAPVEPGLPPAAPPGEPCWSVERQYPVPREAGGGSLPTAGSRLSSPPCPSSPSGSTSHGGSPFSGATIAFPESSTPSSRDVKRLPSHRLHLGAAALGHVPHQDPREAALKKLALLLKIPSFQPSSGEQAVKEAAGADQRGCWAVALRAGGPGAAGG